jgi:hypothetical protein
MIYVYNIQKASEEEKSKITYSNILAIDLDVRHIAIITKHRKH